MSVADPLTALLAQVASGRLSPDEAAAQLRFPPPCSPDGNTPALVDRVISEQGTVLKSTFSDGVFCPKTTFSVITSLCPRPLPLRPDCGETLAVTPDTSDMPSAGTLLDAYATHDKLLFDILKKALPFIAKVTGGYAAITNLDGVCICTVDSEGTERTELAGLRFQSVSEKIDRPGITSLDCTSEEQSGVLPLGPFALAYSNIERIQRDQQLFESLCQALPIIARLMGGEAVLFDKEGRRLASYAYDGNPNTASVGRISSAAAEAMRTNRPTIGPSTSVEGAVAVRLPVTSTFGFGFNNEQIVKREKILLNEVRKHASTRFTFIDIEGDSPAIVEVKEFARSLAASDSSVFIFGETGTGKELFAQSIHNDSPRRTKPFVAINCGALPASIIESILFGYTDGAFTGGRRGGSSGAFEQADGGTLFLDEVSEMDVALQSKILRALQEREIVRLGGNKPVSFNIRVLSAANKDLWSMMQAGTFRADLYYRLNVVQITIPPLRDREGDIMPLIRACINRNNQLFGKFVIAVSPEAEALLCGYSWPGNVRELQNCMEYAFNILTAKEQLLLPQHLPPYVQTSAGTPVPAARSLATHLLQRNAAFIPAATLKEALMQAEKACIMQTLAVCGGNKQKAAERLGISSTTLWRRMVR